MTSAETMTSNVVPFARKGKDLASRSDDELMLLSSRGLHAAFEQLVRMHARRVVGFCVKHTGQHHAGEEMAQEVWLSVWNHRADYRPEGKFAVWLFTLARNRVRNARRDDSRRPRVTGEDDAADTLAATPDLSPSELDRLLVAERRDRVDRALSLVPEKLREAVILRFSEDLSYEDVARVQSTNESTARSRVFHGLRELRRRLRGES